MREDGGGGGGGSNLLEGKVGRERLLMKERKESWGCEMRFHRCVYGCNKTEM